MLNLVKQNIENYLLENGFEENSVIIEATDEGFIITVFNANIKPLKLVTVARTKKEAMFVGTVIGSYGKKLCFEWRK